MWNKQGRKCPLCGQPITAETQWNVWEQKENGQLSHNLEIGSDLLGNISCINYALESMPKQLAEAQTKLETAKVEVTKPFAKEAELAEKLEAFSESQTLKTMVHETAHSMLRNREVNKEPIGADDVILKITHSDGFEVERIIHKAPEEVQEIMGSLTKLEQKDRKNIHDCLESYGADHIPIIVDGGRNSDMPQFNDFEIDLNKKEVVMMKKLG